MPMAAALGGYSGSPNYIATVIEMDRFLASLGFLEGEPILISVDQKDKE